MEKQLVLDFIQAVNAADIVRMTLLMSDDHLFTDAGNREIKGREAARQAWVDYFQLFPDYHIEVMEVLEQNKTVGVFGYASGTHNPSGNIENHFRLPSAWRVMVRDAKLVHWQEYCDTRIPGAIANP